jgi:fimbrial isopeptide formation D2 family protein/LPXTG-motif cell wall-anchored protein
VVNFEVRIPIANGAINYAFKDDMSAGLTKNEDVTVYLAASKGAALPDSPTAIADGDEGYGTLSYPTTGNDEIVISFRNAWLTDNVGKEIVIRYSATVNADAIVADASNPNKAKIEWGNTENPLTDEDEVDVYSAKIIVKKVDGNNQPLEGAGFILKNANDEYYINTNGIVTWGAESAATEIHPVQATNDASEKTGDAVASFVGLPNGTYTLIEKTVPAGYNKAADQTLTIKDANANNLTTELTLQADVTNNQGTELPSTGGIGTTIFYIVGGMLLIGAAIVLVARRKAQD